MPQWLAWLAEPVYALLCRLSAWLSLVCLRCRPYLVLRWVPASPGRAAFYAAFSVLVADRQPRPINMTDDTSRRPNRRISPS